MNRICKTLLAVLVHAMVGAALGAVVASLYGAICCGVWLVLHTGEWKGIGLLGHFALCGAAGGALIGAVGRLLAEDRPSARMMPSANQNRTRGEAIAALYHGEESDDSTCEYADCAAHGDRFGNGQSRAGAELVSFLRARSPR